MGSLKNLFFILFCSFVLLITSCINSETEDSDIDSDTSTTAINDDDNDDVTADVDEALEDGAGVKITASIANINTAIPAALPGALPSFKRLEEDLGDGSSTDDVVSSQVNITPGSYKLALVNFWLLKDDGTEVNILNTDEDNPTYTTERPLIVDFSEADEAVELFSADSIEAGTYTGYKMQFVYMEMLLPVVFHIPDETLETDVENIEYYMEQQYSRNFRLYYNATGKYWKRDFVVELEPGTGEWYWMRRSLDLSGEASNFFIKVDDNEHPPGGAGFDSTLDLFADEDFWGAEDTLDDEEPIIYLSTDVDNADVTVELTGGSFTIPEEITEIFNINVEVDIQNTMNYSEGTTAYTGTEFNEPTFVSEVLDLGPDVSEAAPDKFGDEGLHPFAPRLTLSTSSGATDEYATATESFQVPLECTDNDYTEPATCYDYYCTTENEDDVFCVNYEE